MFLSHHIPAKDREKLGCTQLGDYLDSSEFKDEKKQNRLRDEDIEKIVTAFRKFEEVEKYSHLATLEEIQEAEFNLNIPAMWIPSKRKRMWIFRWSNSKFRQ